MKKHPLKTTVLLCVAFFPLWSSLTASAANPIRVELATILPIGTGQGLALQKLRDDWNAASGGEALLRIAPGGQHDGEATIVRKLRSGNYQAALLSAVGLSEIDPDVSALQLIPLAFHSWDEVDFVREKLRGALEERLRTKGFVVLFWADSGWVKFFSTEDAATPEDFKRLPVAAWAGSDRQMEIMKRHGFKPVALEPSAYYEMLGAKTVKAAPIAAPYALAAQIQSVAPYVLDVKWAPIVGAAIIRQDAWKKIPAELRKKLLALCDKAGADIRSEGRRFDASALKTLRNDPNIHVRTPTPEQWARWEKLGKDLGPEIRGTLVPARMYDRVQQLLQEYRAAKTVAR